MPFLSDHLYPHLVNLLGDPPPIREIRQELIPLAEGKVLEIGAGSGANFVHYDATRVSKLYALEPNPGMIPLAQKQLHRTRLNVEFLDLPGERIPLEDNTMDTVVSTFTLCTIPAIGEAIQGLRRVLKPDGKLIFFELGLSPDPAVQRWQKEVGTPSSVAVPGFVADAGYSGFADARWFSNQADGNGIYSRISKAVNVLLVGHCNLKSWHL